MSNPKPPKLLDQVRDAMRLKHYSLRTEETYIQWIRKFILFHGKKHPRDMAEPEITAFLTHLAVQGKVSASTQNQALSALLFLYRVVLNQELEFLDGVVRAKKPSDCPWCFIVRRLNGYWPNSRDTNGSWPACCMVRACG